MKTSGRGPAAPVLLFDEFAFVQGVGATASSSEIYSGSTPSVIQFGEEALIVQTSSPWDEFGQLYAKLRERPRDRPGDGKVKDPGIFVVQLPSWELYDQPAPANTTPMRPNGPCFPVRRPVITEEQAIARREQGVDTAVEFEAQFAVAGNAYLRRDKVRAIFQPWNGRTLVQ